MSEPVYDAIVIGGGPGGSAAATYLTRAGKRVLIAAHGNSLRALVKYLDNMSEADIVTLNIPTGEPDVFIPSVFC